MRILIGTPCANASVNTNYLLSIIETYQRSLEHKVIVQKQIIEKIPNYNPQNPEHQQTLAHNMAYHTFDLGLYTMSGESLLSRGRNHIAQAALMGGWDKLFFIDADEGWTWEDFVTIAGSPYPIAAGVVPLKNYWDFPRSFQTSLNFMPFLDDDKKFFPSAIKTLSGTIAMAQSYNSPWVKVAYTGTGFLCISVDVLARLSETSQEYFYPNPTTGLSEVHWSFFDGGPMYETYFSEDWQLCEKARALGYDIMVNVNARINHMGPHLFRAG